MQVVEFEVNGRRRSWRGDPLVRLLDVLRDELGLMGTKEGCGEGECGACTVLLDGQPVCACLVPMLQVDGRVVVTVEGLARDGALDPVQQAFVETGGVQCGACTPGMVVVARALLDRHPQPDEATIREHISGTLCRCTGYEGIVEAVRRAAGGAP